MSERFLSSDRETKMFAGTKIIIDRATGVQYLFAFDGYAGGMTVLVDKDGKPLLEKGYEGPYSE